jgi:hypothetical protein
MDWAQVFSGLSSFVFIFIDGPEVTLTMQCRPYSRTSIHVHPTTKKDTYYLFVNGLSSCGRKGKKALQPGHEEIVGSRVFPPMKGINAFPAWPSP